MSKYSRRGYRSRSGGFKKKRRGSIGRKRSSRSSRKKFINRITISRGGIRL